MEGRVLNGGSGPANWARKMPGPLIVFIRETSSSLQRAEVGVAYLRRFEAARGEGRFLLDEAFADAGFVGGRHDGFPVELAGTDFCGIHLHFVVRYGRRLHVLDVHRGEAAGVLVEE